MTLVYDHNPGAYAVKVPCLTCGGTVRLADAVIDRDGPAFRAYYCETCKPAGSVTRCSRPSGFCAVCRDKGATP